MKEETKTTSVSLSPEVLKKIEDGKYNRSKLIDSLLTKYFENKTK